MHPFCQRHRKEAKGRLGLGRPWCLSVAIICYGEEKHPTVWSGVFMYVTQCSWGPKVANVSPGALFRTGRVCLVPADKGVELPTALEEACGPSSIE